jgi:orotidine-5'-phosphate decarboxylase
MAAKDRSNRLKLKPQERLIVALDVPGRDQALEIVDGLDGLVSFYKVGLELLMSGGIDDLLRRLVGDGKDVFVDLKLPSDIPETVRRVVSVAADRGVKLLTLSGSVPSGTIREAVKGRGDSTGPQLLFVSFLSSLDRSDFAEMTGMDPSQFEAHMRERTGQAKAAGADGFIVSGNEIGLLRDRYPDALLVSPGIRPAGASTNDHKRSCTPAEAIRLGADYLVVGRPIRDATDRREAAKRIIDEIAEATFEAR